MTKDNELTVEQKVVFAAGPMPDAPPLLMFGIPEGAWEYMKNGKTHTFDLNNVGLPIQIMMYGGKDHDEVMNVIKEHNKKINQPYLDMRNKDFSIKHPPKQEPKQSTHPEVIYAGDSQGYNMWNATGDDDVVLENQHKYYSADTVGQMIEEAYDMGHGVGLGSDGV